MEFLEVFWCCGSHDIDLNLFLLNTLWMALKVVSNFIILMHEQLLFYKDLVLLPSKWSICTLMDPWMLLFLMFMGILEIRFFAWFSLIWPKQTLWHYFQTLNNLLWWSWKWPFPGDYICTSLYFAYTGESLWWTSLQNTKYLQIKSKDFKDSIRVCTCMLQLHNAQINKSEVQCCNK